MAQEMRATVLLQVQALKNTLLRGEDPKDYDTYTNEFEARADELRRLRSVMEGIDSALTTEERSLLRQFDTAWGGYMDAWPRAKAAFTGSPTAKAQAADAVIRGKDRDAV